jgi:CHASE3 domain sensor protein
MATRERAIGERPTVEVQATHIELPVELHRALKTMARARGTSLAHEIRRACTQLVEQEREKVQS